MNGNEKKAKQLGMPFGTATGQLRKIILFDLVKKMELDTCVRCGKKIETIEELSIEHIVPWIDSKNPVELFFDLNNIAFSHLRCNILSVRKEYLIEQGKKWGGKNKHVPPEEGLCWRSDCKQYKSKEFFSNDKWQYNGKCNTCKECRKKRYSKSL